MNSFREITELLSNTAGNPLLMALLIVFCYFIGSFSPAITLGKIYHVDVRKEGSGNAGTTNVLRTIGKKAALITLLVDILKGVVAVLLGYALLGYYQEPEITMKLYAGMCGFAALVGHTFPLAYEFKGGKGVATVFGVILAIEPRLGLIVALIALLVMLLTQRVSAGALTAALFFPIIAWFFDPLYVFWALLTAALVIGKHHQNVKRLFAGTEPKVSFGNGKKDSEEAKNP